MFSTVDLPKNPWIVSRSVEQWVPWALTNAARRSPWLGTHQGPGDESTVVTKVYQETTVEFYSHAMSGCQFFEWARKEWTSERKFLVSRWFPFLWTRNHGVCNSRGAPVIFFGQGPCGQGLSEFLFSKFAVGIDNPQVGGFLLGLPRPSTFDVGMEFTFGALTTTGHAQLVHLASCSPHGSSWTLQRTWSFRFWATPSKLKTYFLLKCNALRAIIPINCLPPAWSE